MTTPSRGVVVQLDKERRLRFPLGDLRSLETGDQAVTTLIWLGLKHEDPDLTPEMVGEILDLEMLVDLVEPLKKASGGIIDLSSMFEADPGKAPATTASESTTTSS